MKIRLKYSLTRSFKWFSGIVFISVLSIPAYSQNAGISANGSVPPNSSAGLDINFSVQGLLIPRIALASTTSFAPLASHVAGMIIYNTATTGDVVPGFYFNNGARWIQSFPKAIAAGDMQYWNGTSWTTVTAGQQGQILQINGLGVPAWTGGGFATMSTTAVSGITVSSASSGGNITNDGGNAVTARGVCWGTTPNPIVTGNKTVDGAGTGSYTSSITGLTTATIYYIRAYATNSSGTSYGNLTVITTP